MSITEKIEQFQKRVEKFYHDVVHMDKSTPMSIRLSVSDLQFRSMVIMEYGRTLLGENQEENAHEELKKQNAQIITNELEMLSSIHKELKALSVAAKESIENEAEQTIRNIEKFGKRSKE